ncbi:MAG TPA: PIN domain-containing protein [Gemmatimonadota bacterium]|nr:PIN domain-containing protein [Gemmatimonadota bacterium]
MDRTRRGPRPPRARLNSLLDTHFVLGIALGAPDLEAFDWLARYEPWGVSPVALLEIAYLAEVGRVEVDPSAFATALESDPRFLIDEVPLYPLIRHALGLSWTRDPFDRLLVAHSATRRVPFVTLDRAIRRHHPFLPYELRG